MAKVTVPQRRSAYPLRRVSELESRVLVRGHRARLVAELECGHFKRYER